MLPRQLTLTPTPTDLTLNSLTSNAQLRAYEEDEDTETLQFSRWVLPDANTSRAQTLINWSCILSEGIELDRENPPSRT